MLKAFVFALGLSTIAASLLLTSAPAGARDDAMTKIDCSKAGSTMSDAAKMGTTTATSGDVDKDFLATATDHEKGILTLMKVEAACGKDPKMKAMAAKGLESEEARMQMFRNMNTSQ